jgi:hypothetical protein
MKVKRITEETTNRGEYNRAYKRYLNHEGLIHCDRCGYHKHENYTGKWYGGYILDKVKQPSWKLVSKHPKQWMDKPTKTIIKTNGWLKLQYVSVIF